MIGPIIKGNQIQLRPVDITSISHLYISWLNDSKVNKFLETRHIYSTIETQSQFVSKINNSPDSLIYGI